MKNLKITALALAVIACAACGSSPKNLAEPYHISLDITGISPDAPPATLSAMVDSIEYIPLEFAEGFPVGNVLQIALTDDYLIANAGNTGLLQFRRDGGFVRRLGNIGRGPGEYQIITSVHVDPARGVVYAIAPIGDAILQYDLATGRFLGNLTFTDVDGEPISSEDSPRLFVPLTDNLLLSTQGRGTMFNAYAPLSETTVYSYRLVSLPDWRVTFKQLSPIYTDSDHTGPWMVRQTPTWNSPDGRTTFYENLADTMYVVAPDGSLTPRIIPDFGMRKITEPVFVDPRETKTPGITVTEARESGRYIVFYTSMDDKSYYVTFDKQTGERRIALNPTEWHLRGPANDLDGGLSDFRPLDHNTWWISNPAFRMIETLTPEHFESVRAGVKDPAAMARLQALVAGLTEDDNPVIAIAHVKK